MDVLHFHNWQFEFFSCPKLADIVTTLAGMDAPQHDGFIIYGQFPMLCDLVFEEDAAENAEWELIADEKGQAESESFNGRAD